MKLDNNDKAWAELSEEKYQLEEQFKETKSKLVTVQEEYSKC